MKTLRTIFLCALCVLSIGRTAKCQVTNIYNATNFFGGVNNRSVTITLASRGLGYNGAIVPFASHTYQPTNGTFTCVLPPLNYTVHIDQMDRDFPMFESNQTNGATVNMLDVINASLADQDIPLLTPIAGGNGVVITTNYIGGIPVVTITDTNSGATSNILGSANITVTPGGGNATVSLSGTIPLADLPAEAITNNNAGTVTLNNVNNQFTGRLYGVAGQVFDGGTTFTGSLVGNASTATVASNFNDGNLVPGTATYTNDPTAGADYYAVSVTTGKLYCGVVTNQNNADSVYDPNNSDDIYQLFGFIAPSGNVLQCYDGNGDLVGQPVSEQVLPAQTNLAAINLYSSNLNTYNFNSLNALYGQSYCQNTLIPTNTYYGFKSGTGGYTNIVCMGTNSASLGGYLLLAYSNGWPHLKRGDQFNVQVGNSYNEQWWIVDVTNNPPLGTGGAGLGFNVDAVSCFAIGSGITHPIWTNVWVQPAAQQNTDCNGNPGSAIGGDGSWTLIGEKGSLHNSARVIYANGYWTFASYVNDDGDGYGKYFTTSPVQGNPAGFAQCWGAPGKSIILQSNGNFLVSRALQGPGSMSYDAQTSISSATAPFYTNNTGGTVYGTIEAVLEVTATGSGSLILDVIGTNVSSGIYTYGLTLNTASKGMIGTNWVVSVSNNSQLSWTMVPNGVTGTFNANVNFRRWQ